MLINRHSSPSGKQHAHADSTTKLGACNMSMYTSHTYAILQLKLSKQFGKLSEHGGRGRGGRLCPYLNQLPGIVVITNNSMSNALVMLLLSYSFHQTSHLIE